VGSGSDADNAETASLPSFRVVAADPRKFSAYVLVPDHPSGKDRIFLELLGYRPRSEEDARTLVATYVAQASERLSRREYTVGRRDHHGQRYTIEIELGNVVILSGWILRPDGTLWLATPFTGFADQERS
jgi:hypothetical protein